MKIIAFTLAACATSANGFAAPKAAARTGTSLNSLEKYADELQETAKQLIRPGRGLLACDESTGTVGARLEGIGMENIEDNCCDVSHFAI